LQNLSALERLGHFDSDLDKIQLVKEEMCIDLIEWDPFENNILVTTQDGSLHLISYQGFTANTQTTQQFERQSHAISSVVWANNRSGSFFTSSSKVGIVLEWNVAIKEPKKSYKVGGSGVHQMVKNQEF
jgi:WD40 repeat protein